MRPYWVGRHVWGTRKYKNAADSIFLKAIETARSKESYMILSPITHNADICACFHQPTGKSMMDTIIRNGR